MNHMSVDMLNSRLVEVPPVAEAEVLKYDLLVSGGSENSPELGERRYFNVAKSFVLWICKARYFIAVALGTWLLVTILVLNYKDWLVWACSTTFLVYTCGAVYVMLDAETLCLAIAKELTHGSTKYWFLYVGYVCLGALAGYFSAPIVLVAYLYLIIPIYSNMILCTCLCTAKVKQESQFQVTGIKLDSSEVMVVKLQFMKFSWENLRKLSLHASIAYSMVLILVIVAISTDISIHETVLATVVPIGCHLTSSIMVLAEYNALLKEMELGHNIRFNKSLKYCGRMKWNYEFMITPLITFIKYCMTWVPEGA